MHYQDTKDSIAKILFEYTSSHDVEEARRCLRALDLPFFHHEVLGLLFFVVVLDASTNGGVDSFVKIVPRVCLLLMFVCSL